MPTPRLLQPKDPKCWELNLVDNAKFGGANIITPPPGTMFMWSQVVNRGDAPIQVRLNGDPEATFTLDAGEAQAFEVGDLYITSYDFACVASSQVQIIAGVVSA